MEYDWWSSVTKITKIFQYWTIDCFTFTFRNSHWITLEIAFKKRLLYTSNVTCSTRASKLVNTHYCGSMWNYIVDTPTNDRAAKKNADQNCVKSLPQRFRWTISQKSCSHISLKCNVHEGSFFRNCSKFHRLQFQLHFSLNGPWLIVVFDKYLLALGMFFTVVKVVRCCAVNTPTIFFYLFIIYWNLLNFVLCPNNQYIHTCYSNVFMFIFLGYRIYLSR